jgi:hypothetical protein
MAVILDDQNLPGTLAHHNGTKVAKQVDGVVEVGVLKSQQY